MQSLLLLKGYIDVKSEVGRGSEFLTPLLNYIYLQNYTHLKFSLPAPISK